MSKKISATIITLNEEEHLLEAIESLLPYVDEVVVVDSHSTDQTASICQSLASKGVVFAERKFEGHGDQKNYAASLCSHDWIFNLDADERLTPELGAFLKGEFQEIKEEKTLFSFKRLNFFAQKPIWHGGWDPDWKKRLYHRRYYCWSTPAVHEDLVKINGKGEEEKKIPHHLWHYTFDNVEQQVQRNSYYAKLGARQLLQKRRGIKPSFFLVVVRPLIKFLECYVWKKGFLDGQIGFMIAINAAYSLFLKYLYAHQGRVDS